jgi:hypothetical protein
MKSIRGIFFYPEYSAGISVWSDGIAGTVIIITNMNLYETEELQE